MLEYESAKSLYQEIRQGAAGRQDPEFTTNYDRFLHACTEYAGLRTEWTFMDALGRIGQERFRSVRHEAQVALLDTVCRELGLAEKEQEILPDMAAKGDFACYVTLFLALEQR